MAKYVKKKRQNHYKVKRFNSIFLFDNDWLAYDSEINYVSLADAKILKKKR